MGSVGIDLGTTTTVIARRVAGQTDVMRDYKDAEIVPSVVAYTPAGRIEVGKTAKARRLIDSANTLYSVKRIIGSSWLSLEVSEYRRHYPFKLERGEDNLPRYVTRKGKLTAAEAMRDMLGRFLETYAGLTPTESAAITVPSTFKPEQRAAVESAAVEAGLTSLTLVDEPHAAALPYAGSLAAGTNVAVYDLGGGTFDLAVLEATDDGFALLATGGDAYLGGDDIDLRCATWAAQRILEVHRWDVASSDKSFQSLLFACERAKVRLSDAEDTLLPLGQVEQVLEGKHLRIERVQLEKLFSDMMQRTFVICDDVVSKAGLAPRDINAVILAGGGTYIPTVQAGVQHYFGCQPLITVPPDRVVAIGAAESAARA